MRKNIILFSPVFVLLLFFLAGGFYACSRTESVSSFRAANELRYGLTTEPVTLDPLNSSNTADGRSLLFNVFEGLVKPDSTGALVPAVAESFRIEQNGLIYVFTLREGIRFHDGNEVKPSDVVFSLNTAKEARFTSFSQIDSIDVSGTRDIVIRLREADTDFLPYLTAGIVPEDNPDRERDPIGTGPFIIESYLPQQTLTLIRNPYYWQKDLPLLDRVTVVFVADADTLLTGLRGGNIEGAAVTGSLLSQLNPRDFDMFPWPSNMVQLLALNNDLEPFNDIRVRQAINYTVDIPRIIDTAFYGYGELSGSPLIPGLEIYYEESLRDPYPRDLERAKNLLAQAGYPNGFSLEIAVPSNYTMHVDTAQVLVNQFNDVGITATIRLVDWATWLSDIYYGRGYQATIISLDASNVSPRSFLARYVSTAGGNFINFRNSDYDRVYNAALAEMDEARRISLYKQAQRIVSENAASVYIQDILSFRVFVGGRFDGVVNYPLSVIDFASMYRK